MRNFRFTLVAMLLIAAMVAGCGGSEPKAADVIKIGHAVALTGDSSMWGQAEKNALEMEIEKINKAGGVLGKKIQLIAYDTRADATEAVNVTKRFGQPGQGFGYHRARPERRGYCDDFSD